MIKNLIKIAEQLDKNGFSKEADIVDIIIKRVASENLESEDVTESNLTPEEFDAMISGTSFED
jgi:hypothetical protein